MYHVRKTKTASGSTAVQVVYYVDRKLIVAVHIGSARTNEELKTLKAIAFAWITKTTKQPSLFCRSTDQEAGNSLTLVDKCEYLGIRYAFLYEILHTLVARFGLSAFCSKLLQDLVIIRIMEPASKLSIIRTPERIFRHSSPSADVLRIGATVHQVQKPR